MIAAAFFNHLRDLVVSGFYTSEIGIADLSYLGNEPQSEWHECPEAVLIEMALARAEKTAACDLAGSSG